jgi:PAS domain-containing protein
MPLTAIADTLPCMVGYWDKDLRCQFANNAYLDWFGRHPDNMYGTSIMELLGERLFDLNKRYISGAMTGTKQQFERTLIKPNGISWRTLANYIPDINTEGAVSGFYALVTGVTPIIETTCRIPCDHMPIRSWPLFRAREVMRGVIESFKAE